MTQPNSLEDLIDLVAGPGARQSVLLTPHRTLDTDVTGHLESGSDSRYVTSMENFGAWSHEAIVAAPQTMDPTAVSSASRVLGQIQTDSLFAFLGFEFGIKRIIGDSWEGAAADAALAATSAVTTSGRNFSAATHSCATRLKEVSVAIEGVKVAVPPVPSPVPTVLIPIDPAASQLAGEEQRRLAVQAMNSFYVPNYQQAGDNVPVLPPPHDPTAAGGVPGGGVPGGGVPGGGVPGGGVPGGGVPAGPGGSTNQGGGPDAGTTRSTRGDNPEQPGGPDKGTDGGPGSDALDTAPASTQNPASTDPAGYGAGSPATSADHGSRNPAGSPVNGSQVGPGALGQPGAMGSGGRATGGGGPRGSGGAALGGDGKATGGGGPRGSGGAALGTGARGSGGLSANQGSPTGTGSGPAGAGGTRNNGSGRGAMPAMMPGAGRGQGDADTEHRTPSYLITLHNGNELIGPMPLVAPPVIGDFRDDE